MSNYLTYNKRFMAHWVSMEQFRLVEVEAGNLFETYLGAFKPEHNGIFKTNSIHDCNCCKEFIRKMGHVVALKDGEVITMWDFDPKDEVFEPVNKSMAAHIRKALETNGFRRIFKHYESTIGRKETYGQLADGSTHTFNHFFTPLSPQHVVRKYDLDEARGSFNTDRKVFHRSLTEIKLSALDEVLDLINDNNLYRGEDNKGILATFRALKIEFDRLTTEKEKVLYSWENTRPNSALSRIRNTSIGTLLMDLSEGTDIEVAVKKYEDKVSGYNYQRPKALITQKQKDEAEKFMVDNDYINSLYRRFATLEDLTVNNVLFANRNVKTSTGQLTSSPFDILQTEVKFDAKKYNRAEKISLQDFINMVGEAQDVEVLFEGRHANNMASLIAPLDNSAKPLFKWDNSFSWTYANDLADSGMKQNVKNAGGKVDGVLRFSIQWNDNGNDRNDLDAYCKLPNGNIIYYGNKRGHGCGGNLDVDIQVPTGVAVENITWPVKSRMRAGEYKFYVNNYSHRGGRDGFSAEIEFDGEIHEFNYPQNISYKEDVFVATVTLDRNGNFSIKNHLSSTTSTREVWGLTTNKFAPVSLVSYSPNYWDKETGNRHVFFMLKDCINPDQPRGIFNEFLVEELRPHRKVLEALGSKMAVQHSENQLSGIGMSTTKRDDLIVRIDGKIMRVMI